MEGTINAQNKVLDELHPAEIKLIEYIRGMKFGTFNLVVRDGIPQKADVPQQSVKFNEEFDNKVKVEVKLK